MFLNKLTSSDPRFKALQFHDGLNILVADRTDASEQGDSRNSVGKTSFVKILRYVFGGNLPPEFKKTELSDHKFTATLSLPSIHGDMEDEVTVTRPVSPATKIQVSGWSATGGVKELLIEEWKDLLSSHLFRIPSDVNRPTVSQLWGQLVRTYFGNPIKGHPSETNWESGVKIGFMLGLSPEILARAGDIDRLTKQRTAVRKAVRDGVLTHFSLDEPALRAQLSTARHNRDRMQRDLRAFKVDEKYADHQQEADRLTALIQRFNDEALALQRRARELEGALTDEFGAASDSSNLTDKLAHVYAEIGLILPDAIGRRYDEVQAFHQSVVRNRRVFLEQELDAIRARLTAIEEERQILDQQRSEILQLLNETVALDTFLTIQRDFAKQESIVADLERQLETANSISTISDTIKLQTAELISSVRTELSVQDDKLDDSIVLFNELGKEIYTDREASLLISPSPKGLLEVKPHVSGDASDGVRNVKTFMLDIVCEIAAIKMARAPRILVHDSHLFDSVDGRQVASCLNIGARLAEQHGFQYIVTLNSDFLATIEAEGAFIADPYILDTRLTDKTEAGGLFGFRFD